MSRHVTPPSIEHREPAVLIGMLVALITAILNLIVAFGIEVTPDQQGAILTAVNAVAVLLAAILIRGKVYAPATVERIEARAAATGVTTIDVPPVT